MNSTLICLLLASLSQAATADLTDKITPDALLRLLQSHWSNFHDVSFYYEGAYSNVTDAGVKFSLPPEETREEFQGYYTVLGNSAWVFQEVFSRRVLDGSTILQNRMVIDGRQMETLERRSDSGYPDHPMKRPANPFVLMESKSAQLIFHKYMFDRLAERGTSGITVHGWEMVGNVRCLKADFHPAMNATSDRTPFLRLWLDLRRGGNSLKCEYFFGGKLVRRTDQIKLQEFTDSSQNHFWLPTSAVTETFRWERNYYDKPVTRETFYVVAGSVLVNSMQSPDALARARDSANPKGGAWRTMRTAYQTNAKELFSTKSTRQNPADIKKRLDEQLKIANEQAKELDASKSATESTLLQTTLPQILLAALGIGVIVAAIWLRRRAA